MEDGHLTGGCGCGAVRFAVTQAPLGAGYCHCTRCQRRTGTASSVQAFVAPGAVTVTDGDEHLRGWGPEGGMEKVFCARCGSALFSRHPQTGEVMTVRMGAFDADPGVRPTLRQFVAYAAPWEPIPDDGLPRYPERRPD